jgi:hypothetical protein
MTPTRGHSWVAAAQVSGLGVPAVSKARHELSISRLCRRHSTNVSRACAEAERQHQNCCPPQHTDYTICTSCLALLPLPLLLFSHTAAKTCASLPSAYLAPNSVGFDASCVNTLIGTTCSAPCSANATGTTWVARCDDTNTWTMVSGSCEGEAITRISNLTYHMLLVLSCIVILHAYILTMCLPTHAYDADTNIFPSSSSA